MGRSGYSDDCDDQWASIRWRGAVTSAIKGARGQAFLRELIAALDAMPEKKLITNELEVDGQFCALGAVAKRRGLDTKTLDAEEIPVVADVLGIAPALAREIVFMNDEYGYHPDTPEGRWRRVRAWATSELIAQ